MLGRTRRGNSLTVMRDGLVQKPCGSGEPLPVTPAQQQVSVVLVIYQVTSIPSVPSIPEDLLV